MEEYPKRADKSRPECQGANHSIWTLYDLRHTAAAKSAHAERAAWQDESELALVDEDHTVLIVNPGGALRRIAP